MKYEYKKISSRYVIQILFSMMILYVFLMNIGVFSNNHPVNCAVLEDGSTVTGVQGFEANNNAASNFQGVLNNNKIEQAYLYYTEGLEVNSTQRYFSIFFDEEQGVARSLSDVYPNADKLLVYGYYENYELILKNLFYIMIFFLCFTMICCFELVTIENKCDMQNLLNSTAVGSISCRNNKVKIAYVIINITLVIVIALIMIINRIKFGGLGADTSIQVGYNRFFFESTWNITYGAAFLNYIILVFLVANSVLGFTMLLLYTIKSTMVVVALSILYCFGGMLFSYVNIASEKMVYIASLFPINSLNSRNIFTMSPVTLGGYQIQWIYILDIVYFALCVGNYIFLLCRKRIDHLFVH